jgi:hypothetical protein
MPDSDVKHAFSPGANSVGLLFTCEPKAGMQPEIIKSITSKTARHLLRALFIIFFPYFYLFLYLII